MIPSKHPIAQVAGIGAQLPLVHAAIGAEGPTSSRDDPKWHQRPNGNRQDRPGARSEAPDLLWEESVMES